MDAVAEPVVSVVIAAHNEESVIARCLRTLSGSAKPGELDVVVVANGCTDRTAQIARAERARVVETPTAGKANALNLGDKECRAFPGCTWTRTSTWTRRPYASC
ncbi:hypothetical protein GCM10029964_117600 [Kibdelosporangium lantanae]